MKKNIETIKLKPVTKNDYKFLYKLLEERDQRVNISHKKMPTYSEHIRFVKSKPYSKWYVIKSKNNKVGTVYLSKQNEIGIFIVKKFQGQNIGKGALALLIKQTKQNRYLANVSPKNTHSAHFFLKNGFKLIQHTYLLELN